MSTDLADRSRRGWLSCLALVVVTVACLALGLAACGGSDDSTTGASTDGGATADGDPIKVAGIFDITGFNGAFGTVYVHATELAFQEVNEAGGANGHPIEMELYDTATDAATATLETRKALTRDGFDIVYGGVLSAPALAIGEVAESTGALYFSPAAVAPELTEPPRDLTFAVDPTLGVQAVNMVMLMKSMGMKKVGLIFETGAYGEESAEALKAEFEKNGLELSSEAEIGNEPTDATNQVEQMKTAGVDAVVLGVAVAPSVAIIKAMNQQSVDLPVVAVGGGLSEATEELVTSSAPIEYYAVSPLACPLGIGGCGAEFVKRYTAKFNEQPIVWAAQGYVAAQAFIAGLEEAEEFTPDAIASALVSKPPLEDPLIPGAIEFTSDQHLGVSQVYLQGFKEGKAYFFGNDINDNKWPTN